MLLFFLWRSSSSAKAQKAKTCVKNAKIAKRKNAKFKTQKTRKSAELRKNAGEEKNEKQERRMSRNNKGGNNTKKKKDLSLGKALQKSRFGRAGENEDLKEVKF